MSVARVLAAKQIELERKIKAPCSSSFFFFLTFVFKQDEYVFPFQGSAKLSR
jgi:hypothetical protein